MRRTHSVWTLWKRATAPAETAISLRPLKVEEALGGLLRVRLKKAEEKKQMATKRKSVKHSQTRLTVKPFKPGQHVIIEAYDTGTASEGWIIRRGKSAKKVITTASSAAAMDEATATYSSALSRLAKK